MMAPNELQEGWTWECSRRNVQVWVTPFQTSWRHQNPAHVGVGIEWGSGFKTQVSCPPSDYLPVLLVPEHRFCTSPLYFSRPGWKELGPGRWELSQAGVKSAEPGVKNSWRGSRKVTSARRIKTMHTSARGWFALTMLIIHTLKWGNVLWEVIG